MARGAPASVVEAPGEHPGPGLSRCEDFVGQDLDTAPPPRRVELSVTRLVKNEELHETWGVEMHYGGLETDVRENHGDVGRVPRSVIRSVRFGREGEVRS